MSGYLNHSAADVVAQALIDMGAGSGIWVGLATDPLAEPIGAWPVYVDIMYDTPDDQLTVKDTTGRDHGRSMITGTVERDHGIQVLVRARLSDEGRRKIDKVRDAFERGIYGTLVTIGATTYRLHCLVGIGQPLPLGLEPGSARFMHSLNALAVVTQTN